MFIEVGYFDFLTTIIRLGLEQNPFEGLHRRGVNMSLNMHGTQYGLTQHNKILQDVKVLLVM